MIFIRLITVVCNNEKQHRIFTVLFFMNFGLLCNIVIGDHPFSTILTG